jgi:hypothetical protein
MNCRGEIVRDVALPFCLIILISANQPVEFSE